MRIKWSTTSILVGLIFIMSCEKDDPEKQFDCNESTLQISLVNITPAANCTSATGIIEVRVSGGATPYEIFLNDNPRTGTLFSSLSSGIYNVTVKDKFGCEKSLSNLSVMAEGFSFAAGIQANTMCIGGNGSATIDVQEGTPPYQFRFGNGAFSEINSFASLATGNYLVVLKDGNDCTASLNISIPKGNTGTSWTNEIQPLMKTFCALNGCHNGTSRPDLRLYEKAKQYAGQIKSKTRDRSMPFEGSLTQNQIEIITCWVDEGALNN